MNRSLLMRTIRDAFETAAEKTARADACLDDHELKVGALKHAVSELKLDAIYVIRELLVSERDSRKLRTLWNAMGQHLLQTEPRPSGDDH